jgi:hypothetical protein
MWILEKLRRADCFLGSMAARRDQRLGELNPFRHYVPSGHDVFVATYAKSGTNWMLQIAHQLLYHGIAQFDHIHSVVPWPDTKLIPPFRRYAIPLEDPSVWMASPEQKRVIKTHFNWELLPYSEDARYIMVIRDPKDVFVSNYFFLKATALGPAMPSAGTWFKLYLSENFPLGGSWAVNAAGYWAQRHRPNVLILSFKSMKQDLNGAVRVVADFLDVRASDEVIQKVCEQATFDYMKRVDEKFRVWKMTPWQRPSTMLRKGVQGGSSELLSPEQMLAADAYFIAELKRLRSDLPYEEFCSPALALESGAATI